MSGQTYDIKLKADIQAYKICKEVEREQRLALSWERIALTFWGSDGKPELRMVPKLENMEMVCVKGGSNTNL